jgi:hypothetical protein
MEDNRSDTQARFFRKEPGFFVGREFCRELIRIATFRRRFAQIFRN